MEIARFLFITYLISIAKLMASEVDWPFLEYPLLKHLMD